jgi:putative ABC transport system substrate-binding protein
MEAVSMHRRSFLRGSLAAAGLGLLTGCGVLPMQRPPKVAHISYLGDVSFGDANTDAFLARLRELGHVEGESLLIEWRFANGKVDDLPQLAAELIGLPLDLIVTSGPGAAPAVRAATMTQPVVTPLARGSSRVSRNPEGTSPALRP